ncbi:shikimate kinase AroK [Candidatus Methylocalor cossyra]|uniref:Shikimate kinase n=1 Tax=Candidatus Methylocalor cossyra TaxID=3108543 RepID=A0ABP1C911_9GAMM
MRETKNICLIGPMGAGKTTIGRLLAKSLGATFVDSDKQIERRTGVCIPMIFEYEGEAGFRRREAEVLAEVVQMDGIVLATGGGAILLPENRECLRRRGFVVYLYCSIEKQLERTHKDSNRPLLQTADPRRRLLELQAVRGPLYRALADFTIDTGKLSSHSAVRRILRAYQQANSEPRERP